MFFPFPPLLWMYVYSPDIIPDRSSRASEPWLGSNKEVSNEEEVQQQQTLTRWKIVLYFFLQMTQLSQSKKNKKKHITSAQKIRTKKRKNYT